MEQRRTLIVFVQAHGLDVKWECTTEAALDEKIREAGFNVEARAHAGNKDDASYLLGEDLGKIWTIGRDSGKHPKPTPIDKGSFEEKKDRLESKMKIDNGRYVIGINMDNDMNGHAIFAVKLRNKKTPIYYDPQIGEIINIDVYNAKMVTSFISTLKMGNFV